MGRRGAKPTPTEIKVLRGVREDRINRQGPKLRPDLPEPPADFEGDADALEAWDYYLPILAEVRGMLSPGDRDALVAGCRAIARQRGAMRVLMKSPILIQGIHGNMVRNPAIQIERDATADIWRFVNHFGLSPAARASIRLGEQRDGDAASDRLLA